VSIHRSGNQTSAKGVLERDIAARLGVSIKKLADIRRESMEFDVHWVVHDRQIYYTPSGEATLEKELRLGPATARSSPEGSPTPTVKEMPATGRAGGTATLQIIRVCPNPTWVKARAKEGGDLIDVMVANNRWMRKGMELRGCVKHPVMPGRMEWRAPRPMFRHPGGRL
jgi:hypothetical protein